MILSDQGYCADAVKAYYNLKFQFILPTIE